MSWVPQPTLLAAAAGIACLGRDHTSGAAATGAAEQTLGRKPQHWRLVLGPRTEAVGVRVRPCWSASVGVLGESAVAVDDAESAAGAGVEMEVGAVVGSHSRWIGRAAGDMDACFLIQWPRCRR